jgi:CRP-like cAMP-binding protein
MAPHHRTANHFLASLAADDRSALLPHLKAFDLPQETVLYETGDTISAIYFPLAGVVSLVVDLASGDMVEAAMIGQNGLVGGSAALNGNISMNRAVVQVAGSASVVDVDVIQELVERSATFRSRVALHEQFVMAQAQQSAACNASHALEARLASWLLRCRNMLESEDIALTQDFLGEMLGVRRTSVSLVAHMLQQAGLIHYRRGHIRVLNVEGLQEAACECYATIKAHGERLLGSIGQA